MTHNESRIFQVLLSWVLICLPLGSVLGNEPESAAAEGWQHIQAGALLIDVRSAEEYADGHIEGAINVPHEQIEALVAAVGPDLDREVVVYCGSGRRAGLAQQALIDRGYTEVHNAMGYQDLLDTSP